MRFRLLGPLEVLDAEGGRSDVGGPQPRLVLALLLVASGRPVRAEALVDALWGEAPPASASNTLQSYVSRLRRALDADPTVQLPFRDGAYALEVDPAAVDAWEFERLAAEGRALLEAGDPLGAQRALVEAEHLWRGPLLADLADLDDVRALATRLEERRLVATEDRLAAELALGRHAAVVGDLAALAAAHPLREGIAAKHALALYRSGRQAEALRSIADAGTHLREELGIEPGRELRDLEAAILDHDPSLELTPARAAASADHDRSDRAVGEPLAAAGGEHRFVGRDPELRQLRLALEEAEADARFAVIEGEAGIGKTRLAEELRQHAASAGTLAVWGRSDESGAAPALWPWLAPLRAIEAHGAALPAPIAELLGGEAAIGAGQGESVRYELFEAIAGVLEDAGRDRPIVVLVDDLQWADEASLDLLRFLAGRLGAGVLVIGTLRRLPVGEEGPVTAALAEVARRRGSRRLHLRGLRTDATAELLGELDRSVADAIHGRAEGNPFYAIELARLVDDEGRLPADVPGSVSDVVRRRVARLPEETAELLGIAAVVGREVDLGVLARASRLELADCLDRIEPALGHRLLEEHPDLPGSLRFSHALVRDVLLDRLTSLRRARLHLAVAAAMVAVGAGRADAEILAEHLWRAAPVGVGARAADALEAAAEVAASRVAYTAAEELLLRAVRLRQGLGTGPEERAAELRTLVALLEMSQISRYFQGADAALVQRAIDLALDEGDTDLHLRLSWYRWSALATAARVDEAGPKAREFFDLYVDHERADVRAAAHQVMGVWNWGAGRIGEAVRCLDRGLDLLDGVPLPPDPFGAEKYLVSFTFWLYNHLMHGSLSIDEVVEGYEDLHEVIPDPVGRASVCGFAMTTFIPFHAWEHVERFERLGRIADPNLQFGFWGGQLRMHSGLLATWKGQVEDGIELFVSGRDRYLGVGGCSGMHAFEASMAILLAQQGRIDEAEGFATASRAFIDARAERWGETSTYLAEALIADARGEGDLARERLAAGRALGLRQEAYGLVRMLDEAAADLGIDLDAV
ncbi:MAG: BTAD domain-containing putative transcriptional regulator [Acidimicrobiales bacterium]